MDVLGDGISSVELLNHMGDDLMVVNAARVSYAKESLQFNDSDKKLISYLASHGHWTPFSQPQLQFRIKMPIFIAREWYRHTIGLTRNEVSRRYVDTEPEFFIPKELRGRAEKGQSKQGSSGVIQNSDWLTEQIWYSYKNNKDFYLSLISQGVAPEQARIILPMGTYTEFIETGSLAAYARICKLRIQPDAQLETRKYAEGVYDLIEPLFPVSWKAIA